MINMERCELGRFYATSFDSNVFEFIVFNDNTISCPQLGIDSFDRIILKPRFILVGEDFYYTHEAKADKKYQSAPGLIENYEINEDLFNHLKENEMIKYSTDMAYLYGFSDTNGYDKNKRAYKRAEKKGPVLVKQKKGNFN